MNFLRFRTLEAPQNPLIAAYTSATGRSVQDAVTASPTVDTPDAWIPAPEHPEIWAALATVGNNPGVIDHTTPGMTAPAEPQEQS